MAAEPVDELFAVPLADFTAQRDALVKELKAAGDKEAAAEVKALRRPTVAAWAVNQVVRSATGRNDIAALLQLGDRLRDAHDALLEGKGDAAIRELTAERRALVGKLAKQAVAVLGGSGDAQRDAITHTFDAAVADPDAGLVVRAGRLTKELDAPSGFGGGLVFGDVVADRRPRREERRVARQARREPAPAGSGVVGSGSAADRQAERDAAKAAERRRKELQRAADERAAEAHQAAREAAAARQEVSRLQDLLLAAGAKAKAATDRAERAQADAAAAQRSLRESEPT